MRKHPGTSFIRPHTLQENPAFPVDLQAMTGSATLRWRISGRLKTRGSLWIIPMDSTWIVGLLFGIDLFVGGITLLSIFIAIKRIHKRAQSENEAVGNRQ